MPPRNWVKTINLKREFVASIGCVIFADPLMEDAHQALGLGRIGIGVQRPTQMTLGFFELPAVQGLPGKAQVQDFAPPK